MSFVIASVSFVVKKSFNHEGHKVHTKDTKDFLSCFLLNGWYANVEQMVMVNEE